MKCRNCGRELTPSNKSNSYGLCKTCKREEDDNSSSSTYYEDSCCNHSIFDSNDSCDCNCGCGGDD